MADNTRFKIPADNVTVETVIKRSRFVAQIGHVADQSAATAFIHQARANYNDARHHCWAYIACPPYSCSAIRFSDAGEPGGTAGKPILNAIQHSNYGEIICVVSRYFGGIKLGAGGLVRAYSNSTLAALEKLPVTEKISYSQLQLTLPYALETPIRDYLELMNAIIDDVSYTEEVAFNCRIATDLVPEFYHFVSNRYQGKVKIFNGYNYETGANI